MHNSKIKKAIMAFPVITETEAPNEVRGGYVMHEIHILTDMRNFFFDHFHHRMDQLALHDNDFEMHVNGKFQVVHEMFGKLDKKLDMVLEKVAEVGQKIAEIARPSAGPMATNHEYVMELERQIRENKLMVEKNIRIAESVLGLVRAPEAPDPSCSEPPLPIEYQNYTGSQP